MASMATVMKKIEQERERSERRLALLKMLEDPDMLELAEQMFSSNGTSNGKKLPLITVKLAKPAPEAPLQQTIPGTVPQEESKIGLVRRVVAEINGDFYASTVQELARIKGMKLTNIEIGKALQRMVQVEEVEVITRRHGRPGNTYKKTAKLTK